MAHTIPPELKTIVDPAPGTFDVEQGYDDDVGMIMAGWQKLCGARGAPAEKFGLG